MDDLLRCRWNRRRGRLAAAGRPLRLPGPRALAGRRGRSRGGLFLGLFLFRLLEFGFLGLEWLLACARLLGVRFLGRSALLAIGHA